MILFFLIVVVSAFFRISHLNLIEFKTDEAINLLLASRPLFGHPFPFGGTISSVGVLNPPLFNYLLFPVTLISLDPRIMSLFIGLINTAALGGLFLIFKNYYGKLVAFIATLIIALSPWAILFSRKIWSQDLILPIFVPLLLAIHKIVLEKDQRYWFIFAMCSLFLIQLHQVNIFFVFLLIVFLLKQRLRIHIGFLLTGILIGLLPLLPYITYELQSNCPDCAAISRVGKNFAAKYSVSTFIQPLQILNQGNFYKIFGDDFLTFSKEFPLAYKLRSAFYAEYLLIPIGMIIFTLKFKRLRFLAFVTLLLPVFYFVLRIEPLIHYYIIIIPLLALFLACAFTYFLGQKILLLKFISLFLLISISLASIIFNYSFFSLLEKHKSVSGDYGTTFGESELQAKKKLMNVTSGKDLQELLLASYIPDYYMYGYLPLPKMMYAYHGKENQLPMLEKALERHPQDARLRHMILAIHTKTPLTSEIIDLLRQKSKEQPIYKELYKLVYSDYLSDRLKHTYTSRFGFSFEYPQHWQIDESEKELRIHADEYVLLITPTARYEVPKTHAPTETVILNKKTYQYVCIDGEKWCGMWYYPVEIDSRTFLVSFTFNDPQKPPSTADENLKGKIEAVKELLASLRV